MQQLGHGLSELSNEYADEITSTERPDLAAHRMIRGEARVVGVYGGKLVLEAEGRSACSGCAKASGCGVSMLSGLFGHRRVRLRLDNDGHARAGDLLVVGVSQDAVLQASIAMYLIPIVVMIVGAIAGLELGGGDLGAGIGALLGIVAGFLSARWYAGRARARLQPVLIGRVDNGAAAVACDAS